MQNSPDFYRDDLEDRLVDYTGRMIDVVEALPGTRAGNYIAGKLIRSCHSPTTVKTNNKLYNTGTTPITHKMKIEH